jgi:hypothetical protein
MAKSAANSIEMKKSKVDANNSAKTIHCHKLNIPADKSKMSKSDKSTIKAWEYTYKNRDRRVD